MYRILCAAAGAVIFAMPAKADETVKWRHVHHATSYQTLEVGDVNGHVVGLQRLPGIAFFPDGSIGTSLVIGTNDAVSGVGQTVNGYYTVNFADGSALWLKYTGTGKFGNPGTLKGTAIVIGGKGRYAGAKGDGTFEGETIQSSGEGIAYIDNVINIKN
jgi:hypothetical protein